MAQHLPPSQKRRNLIGAFVIAAGLGVLVYAAASWCFFVALGPPWHGWLPWSWLPEAVRYPGNLARLAWYHGLALGGNPRWSDPFLAWGSDPAVYAPARAHLIFAPALLAGLALAVFVGLEVAAPHDAVVHISGPRLLEGRAAIASARAHSGEGVHLHPDLVLRHDQWARGVIIAGSPGSGKTQIMEPVVHEAVAAGARCLVLDTKRDYTGHTTWPILSPWDARSLYWDVAADVRSLAAAQAFAAAMVPLSQGSARHWDTATRSLLTAALVCCQQTMGRKWGWKTLDTILCAGYHSLLKVAHEFYPQAESFLAGGPDSTTTSSTLASLAGHAQVIGNLARAWGDGEGMQAVSMRAWAANRKPRVILLHAGEDRAMSQAWLAACLGCAGRALLARPDSHTRRAFIFLDEMTAPGRLDIEALMERGRSKGVVVFSGFQDFAQVAQVYGDHFAKAMASMAGTHIVCQCGPGETREAVAKWAGQRRVALPGDTVSHNAGGEGASHAWREEMRPLVLPSDVAGLGPVKHRHGFSVRAIALGHGDPLLLTWPGATRPNVRPGFIPAPWTQR